MRCDEAAQRALQDQGRARPCQNGFFGDNTVYIHVSLFVEFCCDLEIVTSNTDLAVILVYFNYLSAVYMLIMFYLLRLENISSG